MATYREKIFLNALKLVKAQREKMDHARNEVKNAELILVFSHDPIRWKEKDLGMTDEQRVKRVNEILERTKE